ncbi:MAG: group II intron reverse transcriptase/maturase [Desulfobulbaceae bacterium]|nr:group II intron reverse transcriptase/maturase [Desulfobulbaceae bacterium]
MPGTKVSRRPSGVSLRENLEESLKEGKQMTVPAQLTDAPANRYKRWKSIPWRTVTEDVRRLQMRIAKAVMDKKHRKASSLQWLLTHSYHAKLLAIKRVTSNRGKRTPGVDGVVWTSSRQKLQAVNELQRRGYTPLPMRRIYIPKKNGKKRPLSIPTMRDRAMQALYKMALDPVAETTSDPNSYGFRQHRRCADAIGQCFVALAKRISPVWVLEGDIKACFDEISHRWILDNILLDKRILAKWLNAGYMEEGKVYPTRRGTPQGGIISPTLANMVLDGLETAARTSAPSRIKGNIRSKINVTRYADDFIVTGHSRELLEENVKPAIEAFLQERGLSLSIEKTKIVRIDHGFDFLSQNVRKYKGKLLIKPARDSVTSVLGNIRDTIRKYRGAAAEVLIGALNPIIRGWVNYHRHIVSKRVFSEVSNYIYHSLWKWMRRKHQKKNKHWLARKYWLCGPKPWVFSARVKKKDGTTRIYELLRPDRIIIVRHTKIKGEANPFNPEHEPYFRKRRQVLVRQRMCLS